MLGTIPGSLGWEPGIIAIWPGGIDVICYSIFKSYKQPKSTEECLCFRTKSFLSGTKYLVRGYWDHVCLWKGWTKIFISDFVQGGGKGIGICFKFVLILELIRRFTFNYFSDQQHQPWVARSFKEKKGMQKDCRGVQQSAGHSQSDTFTKGY